MRQNIDRKSMKHLLLLLILLSWDKMTAQYLGVGFKQLKTEVELNFPESKITDGVNKDGVRYITWESSGFETTTVLYFSHDTCDYVTIGPWNTASLNRLVKGFNEKCVILSDNHWKSYQGGVIVDIRLDFLKDKRVYVVGIEEFEEK